MTQCGSLDSIISDPLIGLQQDVEALTINTLRMLSVDAIQQANSGHPGLPLGAAPMAYVLWNRFLRANPSNPKWPNRDRFVFSAGHGSALLYALLHLTGYNISLEDIKQFRQWGAKTPGHPEFSPESGIECTTGPLGQGFAMGVGMAIAERYLAARYNRPDFKVINHMTYGLVSDGDLMEGISAEAASLAGHLKLGKLVYLYDDNNISIEGNTKITFTDDTEARFRSYGWQTLRVLDGNDTKSIETAIEEAGLCEDKPSLILVRTHIGYGSPKQDSPSAHGEPLGEEALRATKERFGWPSEPRFYVPVGVREHMSKIERGALSEDQWLDIIKGYKQRYPNEAEELTNLFEGRCPKGWEQTIPKFSSSDASMATRAASGKVLNSVAAGLPTLIGGSGDLAPSTKTIITGSPDQSPEHPEGRNIRFGVREHAMGAIVNGMALHGGLIPYGATFLVFSDYMKPALR